MFLICYWFLSQLSVSEPDVIKESHDLNRGDIFNNPPEILFSDIKLNPNYGAINELLDCYLSGNKSNEKSMQCMSLQSDME